MTCPRCKDRTDRSETREVYQGVPALLACQWKITEPLICTLCLLELERWCTEQPSPGWLLIGPHKWPIPQEA